MLENEKKLKAVQYLLGYRSCQVPPRAVPGHSDASRVHAVLGQHALLEEVFDHAVHVLERDGEVVGWGEAVPEGDRREL